MGIVIGLGGLVALIALLLKAAESKSGPQGTSLGDEDPKRYARGLPESVKQAIIRDSKGLATRTELEAAAGAASSVGYERLAGALYEKAKAAPETTQFSGVPSPFEGISHDAWTKFVKLIGSARARTIGPRGNVGVFQMTIRRLVDFGLMKNPRKVGASGAWTADWAIPQDKFLGDPALQYKVFVKSMTDYRSQILERYRDAVGTVFEGKAATLSGLMAIAHITGIEGLGKWLRNDPPRAKFKQTNEMYAKANGLF